MRIAGKIADLFTDRVWTIDTSSCSKRYAKAVRFIKLIRTTVDTFANNRMGFQCVALSYFVALAIIPLIAFLFAVTGGLGLSDKISEILHNFAHISPEFVDLLIEKANGILESAKGGGLGFISALGFLWTILWLMMQVERVFNNVWGIRRIPRKVYRRFGFYLLILFLIPFVVIIFGAGIVYYANLPDLFGLDLSNVRFLPRMMGYVVFYIITTFTLSAMYKWIPATKVKYRYALKSAAIAAAVFIIYQYLYLETQVFVGRLNTAYGVLAAIPLFLIWINFSWQIIIYGAELCYGYHAIENKSPEWDSENKQ